LTGGKPADYIPELGKADPNLFGIAIATVDGQTYTVGDAEAPFTIQSVSKTVHVTAMRCSATAVRRC
jgi:glutaminase